VPRRDGARSSCKRALSGVAATPHFPVDPERRLQRSLAAAAAAGQGDCAQARCRARRVQRGDALSKRGRARHKVKKTQRLAQLVGAQLRRAAYASGIGHPSSAH